MEWFKDYTAQRGLHQSNPGPRRESGRGGEAVPTGFNLIPDTVTDMNAEFGRNQVLLIYLPKVNKESLVHLALWQGSFDVRDYTRSGSRKLRDEIGLREQDIKRGASPFVVRIPSRPGVELVAQWTAIIAEANALHLATAQEHFAHRASSEDAGSAAGGNMPPGLTEEFSGLATHYGLTGPRMARVRNNVGLLRTLDSYHDMKEDSCVVLYFTLLDQCRQQKLGFRQRDAGGRWWDFEDLFREISMNGTQGSTLLPRLAPFAEVDPYQHFISYELQLNNNHAIGHPATKTNQADVVITDVKNRCLYVVEAKKTSDPDYGQMIALLASIDALTRSESGSVFRGFQGKPVLVLDRHESSPVTIEGFRSL